MIGGRKSKHPTEKPGGYWLKVSSEIPTPAVDGHIRARARARYASPCNREPFSVSRKSSMFKVQLKKNEEFRERGHGNGNAN
jgi:hypothetical protein